MMEQCKFSSQYYDFEKKEKSQYACTEKQHKDGFCIFHNKSSENSQEKILLFQEKTRNASNNKEPLFCIGYDIPDFKFDLDFEKPVYFTKANLYNINFEGAKFNQIDFAGAAIHGNANFSDVSFMLADFIKTKFDGNANFSKTKFHENANFSGAEFCSKFNLNDSQLVGPSFIGTIIKEIDFSLSKFESGDFLGAQVLQNANFIGSEFDKTSFSKTVFSGNVDFTGSKLKRTDFLETQFADVNFSESNLDMVNFSGITVQKNAIFDRAEFEKVEFFKANFQNNVKFNEVDFRNTSFLGVKFQANVNFADSSFYGKAFFKETKFHEANFEKVKFFVKANFISTKFIKEANFSGVEFNEIDFSNSKFYSETNFIDTKFKGIGKFYEVLFDKPKEVIFDVTDLSKVSFLGTDISSIRFGENIRWGGSDGFTLIDEEDFIQSPENHSLESLLASYRNLRENYEGRFRYEDANRIMAKEIKLKKEFGKPDESISDSEILSGKIQELTLDLKRLEEKVKRLEDNLNKKFQ